MKAKSIDKQKKFFLLHGNANKELGKLIEEKKKFKLIMTSPPYNMGREYEKNRPMDSYLKEIESVIAKLVTLLDDGGSLCWQVGSYIDKKTKEMFPLDVFYYTIFKKHNLILRNRIIWHFEHGLHAKQKFSGRYETILWFTKTGDYTFNLDPVRIPSKYPGKKHYRGEKKGEYSGNPLGKNPSDVWEMLINDWNDQIWKIPNVKANHKEKTIHPCQYPVELVERCVLALTNEGDWVLDPYSGVGSTIIAALINNRNGLGIEKYKRYVDISKRRLDLLLEEKLPYRGIGTKIFTPNSKMAVARKPTYLTK